MASFEAFPKISRLNRLMTITEKIDGANSCLVIVKTSDLRLDVLDYPIIAQVDDYAMLAQSRNRFITLDQDNHGFARWATDRAEGLISTLGEGRHFGEFWGSGIQRKYGLTKGEKRFSLFNVTRWSNVEQAKIDGLGAVPVLHEGPFDTYAVDYTVEKLRKEGSQAAPGFMRPEGVIVFHHAANSMFKVTCENDEIPKGLTQ